MVFSTLVPPPAVKCSEKKNAAHRKEQTRDDERPLVADEQPKSNCEFEQDAKQQHLVHDAEEALAAHREAQRGPQASQRDYPKFFRPQWTEFCLHKGTNERYDGCADHKTRRDALRADGPSKRYQLQGTHPPPRDGGNVGLRC